MDWEIIIALISALAAAVTAFVNAWLKIQEQDNLRPAQRSSDSSIVTQVIAFIVTQLVETILKEEGVDYSILQKLLAEGKWKRADMETSRLMLAVTRKEEKKFLDIEDLENFPCEDLKRINQLWLHYSEGKFGFSVQKKIYESLGGTREINSIIWHRFGERVGWRNAAHKSFYYSELTFNLNAPSGHLPRSLELRGMGVGYARQEEWQALFSRLETCNP